MQLDTEPGRVGHVQRPAEMGPAWAGMLGPEFGEPLIQRARSPRLPTWKQSAAGAPGDPYHLVTRSGD
jgi:hypothetical protein